MLQLYKIALLLIIVFLFIHIWNLNKYEHMNPSLLTHQYDSLVPEIGKHNINFYIKHNNRYDSTNKYPIKSLDPLNVSTGLNCGPQFNWNVKYEPGANNTYSDLLWHQISPQMILEDNSLNCQNTTYNAPIGINS